MVVTPLAVSAPWWNKLLRASVVPNEEGYLRVRKQQSQLGSDVEGELASSRSRSLAPSPPCGREAAFCGRPLSGGSPTDQAERARIHADLQAVGLALRPCPPPFFPPPLQCGFLLLLHYTVCLRHTACGSIWTSNGWLSL